MDLAGIDVVFGIGYEAAIGVFATVAPTAHPTF